MKIIGKTWSGIEGNLVPVYECKRHGTRSRTDICPDCEEEIKQEAWEFDCASGVF